MAQRNGLSAAASNCSSVSDGGHVSFVAGTRPQVHEVHGMHSISATTAGGMQEDVVDATHLRNTAVTRPEVVI